MGEIFVGYHELLGRHVAIKVARRDSRNAEFLEARLLEEARSLAAVRHPSVVTVHDFGHTTGGNAYLVMELLEGRSLDRILDERGSGLPVSIAVQLARQVAEGLAAFHAEQIICADVKPDNIMIVGGPLVGLSLVEQPWIKLLDLGTARETRDPEQITAANGLPVLGTSWYMSPEAVIGLALDERSDVYSLGVMLYEMLAGRVPFLDEDDDAILDMHLWREPKPLSKMVPTISRDSGIERLCQACLSKSPEDRPCSMHDFIDQLDEAVAEWAASIAPDSIGDAKPRLNHPASRIWMLTDGGSP